MKVLRPGIADQVRQDLNLLETLIRPLGAAFPSLAPAARGRERVLDELDLEHEASTQRSFARARSSGYASTIARSGTTRNGCRTGRGAASIPLSASAERLGAGVSGN